MNFYKSLRIGWIISWIGFTWWNIGQESSLVERYSWYLPFLIIFMWIPPFIFGFFYGLEKNKKPYFFRKFLKIK
jgi:hypothetical protein